MIDHSSNTVPLS